MSLSEATRSKLSSLMASDRVVLFMKGDRAVPQCGFSARVVQILDSLLPKYTTVDVLRAADVREGIRAPPGPRFRSSTSTASSSAAATS
jgi:monothiol glutaredoxin